MTEQAVRQKTKCGLSSSAPLSANSYKCVANTKREHCASIGTPREIRNQSREISDEVSICPTAEKTRTGCRCEKYGRREEIDKIRQNLIFGRPYPLGAGRSRSSAPRRSRGRFPRTTARNPDRTCEFPSLLRLKGSGARFTFKTATGYRYCCD